MMTATLDRLRTLRLGAMADAYLVQHQDAPTTSLGFDERFSMPAEAVSRPGRALTGTKERLRARAFAAISPLL